MFKSKKILSGVLASSIVILGASVYSYSLFDSHAENPSVVETNTSQKTVEKKDDSTAKKDVSTNKKEAQKGEQAIKSEKEKEKAKQTEENKDVATDKKDTTSTPDTTKKQIATNTGKKQPSSSATNQTVKPAVHIDNNTSTANIIEMAKKSNKSSQDTVTIQYSSDVIVTLNNVNNTGEVKRNYTYSKAQVEYGTKVDYNIVNTSVQGSKAIVHVISPDAGSQAMYDISNELSTLVKEENGSISSTDVYFYDNQGAVNSGNYKWKFSDSTPNKVSERETFTF